MLLVYALMKKPLTKQEKQEMDDLGPWGLLSATPKEDTWQLIARLKDDDVTGLEILKRRYGVTTKQGSLKVKKVEMDDKFVMRNPEDFPEPNRAESDGIKRRTSKPKSYGEWFISEGGQFYV